MKSDTVIRFVRKWKEWEGEREEEEVRGRRRSELEMSYWRQLEEREGKEEWREDKRRSVEQKEE